MPVVIIGFAILFTELMPTGQLFGLYIHAFHGGDFRHISSLFMFVTTLLTYLTGLLVVWLFIAKSKLQSRLPKPIPGSSLLLWGLVLALLPLVFKSLPLLLPNAPTGLMFLGYLESVGLTTKALDGLGTLNYIVEQLLLLTGAIKVLLSAKPAHA